MLKERVALVRNWSYFHLLVFFNVGRQTLFDLKVILLFSTVKSACLRISYHYLAENWRFPTTNGRTKSFNQCRTGLFWFLWPISSSLKDVSFVAVQTATKGRPIRATISCGSSWARALYMYLRPGTRPWSEKRHEFYQTCMKILCL